MRKLLAGLILLLLCALPAAGQGITNATVDGDSILLTVALPGGLGADVILSFEDVDGLSLSSLGVSAQVVNLTDPALLSRLAGATLSSAFPVLLRIEPPADGGLAFRGMVTVEIHTHNLLYLPTTPLRLFSAPLGGEFKDITTYMGSGSYRVRGRSGGFSEFLILVDPRTVNQVITSKLDRLERVLDDHAAAMPATLYADLAARLDSIRADFARGATSTAIQGVDGFLGVVEQHAGTDIPNEWRAARDLYNLAGNLRAGATTLRFSLVLKTTSAGL
jgi:hypothetical protein